MSAVKKFGIVLLSCFLFSISHAQDSLHVKWKAIARIIMESKPKAAMGVKTGIMRNREGRSKPNAPITSKKPMKGVNFGRSAAQLICTESSLMGVNIFMKPAMRNIAPNMICAIHKAILSGFDFFNAGVSIFLRKFAVVVRITVKGD